MADSKSSTEDFDTRFTRFVQLAEEHLTNSCELSEVKMHVETHMETHYVRYRSNKPGTGLRWLVTVDCSTGIIYKVKTQYRDGAVENIVGSIFDADYGKSCFAPGLPSVRRSPSLPDPPKDTVVDPVPYLGVVFFALHMNPRALRIIGWTKSKKSVIIERLKTIRTEENIYLDHKWLLAQPVLKPVCSPGLTKAILKNSPKHGLYVIYEGIYHSLVEDISAPLFGGP